MTERTVERNVGHVWRRSPEDRVVGQYPTYGFTSRFEYVDDEYSKSQTDYWSPLGSRSRAVGSRGCDRSRMDGSVPSVVGVSALQTRRPWTLYVPKRLSRGTMKETGRVREVLGVTRGQWWTRED